MLLLLLAVAWSLSNKARNAILHAINGNGAPDAETGGGKGDGIGGRWSGLYSSLGLDGPAFYSSLEQWCYSAGMVQPSTGKGENAESKGKGTQGLPLQHISPSWRRGKGTSAESTGKGIEVLSLQRTEATSLHESNGEGATSKGNGEDTAKGKGAKSKGTGKGAESKKKKKGFRWEGRHPDDPAMLDRLPSFVFPTRRCTGCDATWTISADDRPWHTLTNFCSCEAELGPPHFPARLWQ